MQHQAHALIGLVLGACPDAPDSLRFSMEADVYVMDDPAKADIIDGCIGELSPFHETFGYYAHGVAEETAILPPGWKRRLIRVENENTGGVIGWCLAPADLAVSKLAAGRDKDVDFVREMLRAGLVDATAIARLVALFPSGKARAMKARLDALH